MRLVAPSHEPFPEPDEADRTEEIVRAFDVVRILSELSEPHRQVLVLAYFEGLSQREISDRIGTPLGTVKSRTSAALRAARQRMFRKAADEPLNKTSEGQLEDG
jgi:RNA polymerase sigma-70 factor (ECF subfamily)